MTPAEAADLLQKGGTLAAAVIAIWALVTRRVVTRGEFDRLDERNRALEGRLETTVDELRKQSSTNARLVEMSFSQRAEAETIRRGSRSRQEVYDEAPGQAERG